MMADDVKIAYSKQLESPYQQGGVPHISSSNSGDRESERIRVLQGFIREFVQSFNARPSICEATRKASIQMTGSNS